VDDWKKSDPIVLLWDRMSQAGIISDAEYKEMDKEITHVVEDAVRFADASPEPPLEELLTDVYV
jgi:pyruvate dehydrogenase E1 component alpha subunit